jgi:hypothetical protein
MCIIRIISNVSTAELRKHRKRSSDGQLCRKKAGQSMSPIQRSPPDNERTRKECVVIAAVPAEIQTFVLPCMGFYIAVLAHVIFIAYYS